jgi:site-specific DNA-methyltransferase (adenine-specific)
MNDKASFSLRGRNPDVLTCIANLSNDEVFTPPEFANRMLDTLAEAWAANNGGADIWSDSSVRFLDPCAKSGVFLREITSRLNKGLGAKIPDLQERVDHILAKQVFGIGITDLTGMLARRSVYCSKHANGKHSVAKSFASEDGNIWFDRTKHTWDRDGKCRYCGANKRTLDRGEDLETHAYAFIHTDQIKTRMKEWFGGDMQFDVIIGNPPYQFSDGGGGHGTSAAPIYQFFVEQAKKLEPRYLSLVIPSRWFAGGKGLDEFREAMLADNRTRVIHDYWLVGEAFPGVAIQGGVCYFLWEREHPGDCEVVTHYNGTVLSSSTRPLMEPGSDVFIRYNEAVPILRKIAEAEQRTEQDRTNRTGQSGQGKKSQENNYSVSLPERKRFSNLVSSRKPFGLPSNFKVRSIERKNDVIAYWNGGPGFKKSGKGWVSRAAVTDAGNLIDSWKVLHRQGLWGPRRRWCQPRCAAQSGARSAFCWPARLGLYGNLSLHRPVKVGKRSRERLLLHLMQIDALSNHAAKTFAEHDEKGLYVRAHAGLFSDVDGRKALCQVSPNERGNRFRGMDDPPDGRQRRIVRRSRHGRS